MSFPLFTDLDHDCAVRPCQRTGLRSQSIELSLLLPIVALMKRHLAGACRDRCLNSTGREAPRARAW